MRLMLKLAVEVFELLLDIRPEADLRGPAGVPGVPGDSWGCHLESSSTSEPDSQCEPLEDALDGVRVLDCVFTELAELFPLSFEILSFTASPQILDKLLDLVNPFEDLGVCCGTQR